MKKSNKLSVFFVISSLGLLLVLIGGGIYGVYLSVGLSFVRSNIGNVADNVVGNASNVSFGGTVSYQSSMTGVIILSIILIVLGIFDIIALVRQIVFFKQFKTIKESKLEQKIEKKIKSKGSVVFFAVVIDILSVIAGVIGIFVNSKAFVSSSGVWVLYVIDGLVAIFAVMSFVLLLIKIKKVKNINHSSDKSEKVVNEKKEVKQEKVNLDMVEYQLLKLRQMKNSRIISQDEYKSLRKKILGVSNAEVDERKKIEIITK